MDPLYHLSYINGEKETHGPIDGNKPMSFSKYKYDEPFNLKVNDIGGTNTGSKNRISKYTGMNFMYRTADIFGAQAGTLKKGIVTKRKLNPLAPKYKFPGYDELQGKIDNNPYDKRALKRLANSNVSTKRNNDEQLGKESATSSCKEEEKKDVARDRNTSSSCTKVNKVVSDVDGIDINAKPFSQDVVKFDKEHYIKPQPFYGFVHDEYLIPPVEEHRKKTVTPTTRSFAEITQSKLAMKGMKNGNERDNNSSTFNKKITTSTIGPLGQTYAQKLDQFMVNNNLKFIEPEADKTVA